MAQEWSSEVNTNFYGLQVTVKENLKKVSFESGKERTYLLNSSPKKQLSVTLDIWTLDEEKAFWNWYENTILSGSLSFNLTDLIKQTGTTEYKLSGMPQLEGQYPKTLSLTLEEE